MGHDKLKELCPNRATTSRYVQSHRPTPSLHHDQTSRPLFNASMIPHTTDDIVGHTEDECPKGNKIRYSITNGISTSIPLPASLGPFCLSDDSCFMATNLEPHHIPTIENEASITFLDFSKADTGVDWDACPKPSLLPPVGDPLIREHSGYFAR